MKLAISIRPLIVLAVHLSLQCDLLNGAPAKGKSRYFRWFNCGGISCKNSLDQPIEPLNDMYLTPLISSRRPQWSGAQSGEISGRSGAWQHDVEDRERYDSGFLREATEANQPETMYAKDENQTLKGLPTEVRECVDTLGLGPDSGSHTPTSGRLYWKANLIKATKAKLPESDLKNSGQIRLDITKIGQKIIAKPPDCTESESQGSSHTSEGLSLDGRPSDASEAKTSGADHSSNW